MRFLFFKLTMSLKQSIELINQLEGAAIHEESMQLLNDLYTAHKEIFKVLEKIENLERLHK